MNLLKRLDSFIAGIGIKLIRFYQQTISPDHGTNKRPTCRFIPTCSEYTIKALQKYGTFGTLLGIKRILKCNGFITKEITVDDIQ